MKFEKPGLKDKLKFPLFNFLIKFMDFGPIYHI